MMVGATTTSSVGVSGGEWSLKRAHALIDELATWAERQTEERIIAEKLRKVEAMAKAEAAGASTPSIEHQISDGRGGGGGGGGNWRVHEFQPWMSEEKHFASKTMATLQSQYAKIRKSRGGGSGTSRSGSGSEVPCAHNILAPKISKLTPEGAAEMARARMAAAEAAEAMRSDAHSEGATRAASPCTTSFDSQLSERPSTEFDPVPYANSVFKMSEDPRYARRLSLTQYKMPQQKVKRVEFTSDTVFEHPKRQ